MIDATVPVDLDELSRMDLEDQLDTLLAVADDERLAWCEVCGDFVAYDESEPGCEAVYGAGARICGSCHEAEQSAIRAELERDMDAMHRARRAMMGGK